jgi:hypothetical protein
VGSIGVFSVHVDASRALDKAGLTVSLISAGKYKTENSPYEPLSDEACQAMPKIVYATYEQFVDAVAHDRGVPPDMVRRGFGEGRVVTAVVHSMRSSDRICASGRFKHKPRPVGSGGGRGRGVRVVRARVSGQV